MNYKLINTGNTDQVILLSHIQKGESRGQTGHAGILPTRKNIPGKAKGEDRNFLTVTEEELRSIFGLYEGGRPGVVGAKPSDVSPEKVTRNKRLLDTGRIIVTDKFGNHVLGVGGDAYRKATLETVQEENAMYAKQIDNLKQILMGDLGISEEDAESIVKSKQSNAQAILKKYEIGMTSKGIDVPSGSDVEETGPNFIEAAKSFFADREVVTVVAGEDQVKGYKTADGAVKKLITMAADAGIDVVADENGLPCFTDADGVLVKLG